MSGVRYPPTKADGMGMMKVGWPEKAGTSGPCIQRPGMEQPTADG